MCCFSLPVESVYDTRIFSRFTASGFQSTVYEMGLETKQDVAMILPLPTFQPVGEHALSFIDLSGYPDFFRDLDRCFPIARKNFSFGAPGAKSADTMVKTIKVEQVGSFEASFVPTVNDFSRLDERFRLPDGTWEKIGAYQKYGFAVFKLRKGASKVHPMAFHFRSAQPDTLFFPTVHIHDGEIHGEAKYDHALYLQGFGPSKTTQLSLSGDVKKGAARWRRSENPPMRHMQINKCRGIVEPAANAYKMEIRGEFRNRDVWVT